MKLDVPSQKGIKNAIAQKTNIYGALFVTYVYILLLTKSNFIVDRTLRCNTWRVVTPCVTQKHLCPTKVTFVDKSDFFLKFSAVQMFFTVVSQCHINSSKNGSFKLYKKVTSVLTKVACQQKYWFYKRRPMNTSPKSMVFQASVCDIMCDRVENDSKWSCFVITYQNVYVSQIDHSV